MDESTRDNTAHINIQLVLRIIIPYLSHVPVGLGQ